MAERGKNIFKRGMDELQPNAQNIRGEITEQAIIDKMNSLIAHGQISPLYVFKKQGDERYTIYEGNERYLGAERAIELKLLPEDWTFNCITIDKDQTSEDQLILLQLATDDHDGFSPLQKAKAYQALKKLNYSIDKIVKATGKTKQHVTETLALLGMDIKLQDKIISGKVSATLIKSERKNKSDSKIIEEIEAVEKEGKTKIMKKHLEPSIIMVSDKPYTIDEIEKAAKKKYPDNFIYRKIFIETAKWALKM